MKAFPEAELNDAFSEWWRIEQEESIELGATAPQPKRPISVMSPIIEIDSHRAVRALLEAEKVLGFRLPSRLVKLGGYASAEEMTTHLVSELKTLFIKRQEKAHA